MPVAPTYPGVYVEELPSGVHTITGVSTAVTAFLGYFSQGPMNQATQIFSPADLERTFGSLVANSEAGYGIQQFFANGGAEAWVVRVAAAPTAGSTTPAAPESAGIVIEEAPSGTGVLQVTAASPGSWGNNVRLAVDPAGTAAFNLTVTLVDSSSPPAALTTEVYRNLTLDPTSPNYAVAVVNNASALVQLALVGTPAVTALPAPTGTVGANVDTSSVTLASLVGPSLDVMFGGTTLTAVSLATAPTSWTGVAVTLQALLQGLTTGSPPAQAIPGATVTLIQGSGTDVQLAISANAASSTFTFGGELATALGLDATGADGTVTNVMQYSLGGSAVGAQQTPPPVGGGAAGPATGSDGTTPNATGLIGDPVAKTGLYALDNVDVFNILCLPDVMNLDDGSAFAVISAAQTYCASRWAFLLVDVPQGGVGQAQRDTLTGIQDWLAQK